MAFVANAVGPGLLMTLAPNHLRGRIYAFWVFAAVVLSSLWPPLVGLLSDRVFHGTHGLFLALCAVIIPCGLAAPAILAFIVGPFRQSLALAGVADIQS
jgi:MFS family permease